jgi:putative flippase GtrA
MIKDAFKHLFRNEHTHGKARTLAEYLGMLITGGGSFLAGLLVFNLLVVSGMSPVWANVWGFVVSLTFVFAINFLWTFKHRSIANPWRSYLFIWIIAMVSFIFDQSAVVWANSYFDGDLLALNIIKLIVLIIGMVIRFQLYTKLVFK